MAVRSEAKSEPAKYIELGAATALPAGKMPIWQHGKTPSQPQPVPPKLYEDLPGSGLLLAGRIPFP